MTFNEVLTAVVIATAAWVFVLLFIECFQIRKKGVLITTVMRATVKKLPWPFILLALTSGFMMGHCFAN